MFDQFPKLQQLKNEIFQTLLRFPLANSCAIICFTCSYLLLEKESEPEGLVFNALICSGIGISFFVSAQLIHESQSIRIWRSWLIKIISVSLAVGFYLSLPQKLNLSQVSQIVIWLGITHLSITFVPFFNRKQIQYFWQFNQSLFLRILQSVLYSGVLFVGIVLALVAIDHLFNVKIDSKGYARLFFFLGFVFNTFFFTAGIPKSFDAPVFYPKGLRLFTQFVLIPLVSIYQIILYCYLAKIVISSSWPTGWVSYLVLFYSGFSLLIVLLIWPLINQMENNWMRLYSRIILFSLIPLSILMGVAVFKRINEYSFTEERLILVVLSAWLIFIAIYCLTNKLKNIKVIPLSLAIFFLVGNFGPWSFYSISKNAQFTLLDSLLHDNKLILNGKWIQKTRQIPKKDLYEIGNKVEYLLNHYGNHALEPLITNQLIDSLNKKGEWDLSKNLLDTMGLEYVNFYELNQKLDMENAYKSLEIQFKEESTPTAFSLEGFNYLVPFEFYADSAKVYSREILFENVDDNKQKLNLNFDSKGNSINLLPLPFSISLLPLADSLFNRYKNGNSYFINSDTKSPVYEITSNSEKYKFLILRIGINSENKQLKINQIKGFLFMKKYY
jgi:hypothetical protein